MDKQKVVHARDGILLGLKKERNLAICEDMGDLKSRMLSEISQRSTNTIGAHLYMELKKQNKTLSS